MRLLIVRHAIAVERAELSVPDAERPLTEEGIRRFRRAAAALVSEVPDVAVVATSPYLRAVATAELLLHAYDDAPALTRLEALAPTGKLEEAVAFLRRQSRAPAVAVVGHDPGLTRLEAILLTGDDRPFALLKKGGAALLDFAGAVSAGRAQLLWHLTAAQLRRLATGRGGR